MVTTTAVLVPGLSLLKVCFGRISHHFHHSFALSTTFTFSKPPKTHSTIFHHLLTCFAVFHQTVLYSTFQNFLTPLATTLHGPPQHYRSFNMFYRFPPHSNTFSYVTHIHSMRSYNWKPQGLIIVPSGNISMNS